MLVRVCLSKCTTRKQWACSAISRYRGVITFTRVFPGRLSPIPGRVRYRQRPQGGRRELSGRLQGRLRHRHDRAASHTPHTSGARPQLLSEYIIICITESDGIFEFRATM